MKAVCFDKYGSPDVLSLRDVEKPVPGNGEVLVKVHAASIAFGDNAFISGTPFIARFWSGLWKPKYSIPGSDFAGTVEAAGSDVTAFSTGDRVYGDLSECGWGAFAEYVCAPKEVLCRMPSGFTFEQASAVPVSGVTALQGLRAGGSVKAGQKVLINGASGGVGTFAVQIAKSFGAEVTAVCSSGKGETARRLGADSVIDYTKEDFTKSETLYDFILGVNGNTPLSDYKKQLTPKGVYVQTGGSGRQIFQAMALGKFYSEKGGRQLLSMGVAKPSASDLSLMTEMAEAGRLIPELEKVYPLSDAAEAFRHFNRRHLRGKIVLSV